MSKAKAIVSADPAANAEATVTIPEGTWQIASVFVPLAQGATQTPLPALQVLDHNGNVIGSFPGASAATSASTTTSFSWFAGATLTAGAGATANFAPIPPGLVVTGGMTVKTLTAGIGANTNFGRLALNALAID